MIAVDSFLSKSNMAYVKKSVPELAQGGTLTN